jgi:PAS domain S-box-containing protein
VATQGGRAILSTAARAIRSPFLPLFTAFAGIAIALLLWQAILNQGRRQATIFAETQARSVAGQLGSALEGQMTSLTHLAQRYGPAFRERRDWAIELVGLKLLFWVEPTGEVRWVIPRTGNEAVLAADFSASRAVLQARQTGRSATARSLIPGPPGDSRVELALPVQAGEQLAGFLVAEFSTRDVFSAVLASPATAPGWSFVLLDNDRVVYRRGPPGEWLAEVPVKDVESSIRLRIAPAPEAAARLESSLPRTVLATGVVIALLLAASLSFAQSSRRRAEQARESEQRYRQFFESHLTGAIVTDPEGRLLEANPVALRMLGLGSVKDFEGRRMSSLYARPEERGELLARVRDREHVDQVEVELRKPDGRPLHVLINMTGRRDAEGRLMEINAFLLDVTDKKRMETQLRQAQKMDAIGRLAGGVAHDFNNLLGVITGYGELLERELTPDHPGRRRLREIRRAADSASALTRQLLIFSRQQSLEMQVVDLNEIVPGAERMLRRLIGEHIELVATLLPGLGRVRADPGQVEQVILNLAINARDAMPTGGRLMIETANVDLDERYVSTHAGVKPGPYVMLAVSDTGHGMDPDTLSHAFEPFFTTKEKGKGTGLGLATVYGIVQQSGGTVNVYSEPGHGTSFKIYLPRIADPRSPEKAAVAPPAAIGGTETILLVEDSDSLREMIGEVLEASGYSVIQASTPERSTKMLVDKGATVDLLLTDVIMPGMAGPELAARLQSTNPRARVLYISGYTDEMIGSHGGIQPGMHFLQKPFTFEALLTKVREVLDARPS